MAEETACGLFDVVADAEQQQEESERGCQEHLEELTLLQTQGPELCFAILGPPWVRNHLSEGMWIASLHHTEMTGELVTPPTIVSFAVEFALECSPDKTFRVEVVDELILEFLKLEERCSRLERPGARNYDMLLGPPSG
jgi:hypothetical protein